MTVKIAFEGIDGAGKSTLCKLLYEHLTFNNSFVCKIAFPTNRAREQLKEFDSLLKSDQVIVANVFLDDYCDNIDVYSNYIDKPEYLVMDRCPLSTIVYQTISDMSCRDYIYAQIQKIDMPDIIIYLKISSELANKRINERGNVRDEMERQDLQKFIDRYENELYNMRSKIIVLDMDLLKNYSEGEVFDLLIQKLGL